MKHVGVILVVLGLGSGVMAQSAWLPQAGESHYSSAFVYQSYNQFYRGDVKAATPFGDLQQSTLFVGMEYAISDRMALDGLIGYTETSGTAASGLGENGLADTTIGIRWRVVDESARTRAPTVTVRLGAIIEGTYDVGNPAAPGNGASGAVGTVMVGKNFFGSNTGVHADLGYRAMSEDVPNAVTGSVSFFKRFRQQTVSTAYRYDGCLSGIDIGSVGFTPAMFPQTREISHAVEVGWALARGQRSTWSLTVARTIDGRNTDRKTVFMASWMF